MAPLACSGCCNNAWKGRCMFRSRHVAKDSWCMVVTADRGLPDALQGLDFLCFDLGFGVHAAIGICQRSSA